MNWRGRGRQQQQPTGPRLVLFRRAVGLFRPYRGAAVALLVLIAADAVLALTPALLIKSIVDAAIPGSGNEGRINRSFLLLAGAIVGTGVLGVGVGWLNQTIGQ